MMDTTNTFCNSRTRKLPGTKIVKDGDLHRTHEASIVLLEITGVIFTHEKALDVFKKHGAKVGGKTVFITGAMVELAMRQAPETYQHTARNDQQSVTIGDGFAPHPDIGCVFCEDVDNGRRRGFFEDNINFQKLSQAGMTNSNSCWASHDHWESSGKESVLVKANKKCKKSLKSVRNR